MRFVKSGMKIIVKIPFPKERTAGGRDEYGRKKVWKGIKCPFRVPLCIHEAVLKLDPFSIYLQFIEIGCILF